MQQLNPSEISDLIKQRIDQLEVTSQATNEGTIVSVTDGIIRIHGLTEVQYGEMIEFDGGVYGLALNLERDSVGAVVLGDYKQLADREMGRDLQEIAAQVGPGFDTVALATLCAVERVRGFEAETWYAGSTAAEQAAAPRTMHREPCTPTASRRHICTAHLAKGRKEPCTPRQHPSPSRRRPSGARSRALTGRRKRSTRRPSPPSCFRWCSKPCRS